LEWRCISILWIFKLVLFHRGRTVRSVREMEAQSMEEPCYRQSPLPLWRAF
jgi:hypothetical protein